MRAVIGLLLVFTGLGVGYLVITGQLPAQPVGAPIASGASGGLPIPGFYSKRNFYVNRPMDRYGTFTATGAP